MGAFAGSAALECRELRSDLSVVTLTINNACNLKCAHCYLQFDGSDALVADYVVDAVVESAARTVSVVGKEPLRDRRTARRLAEVILRAKGAGKRVGFITNGLNASLLDAAVIRAVDWVDVSVDGTAASYKEIRGGSMARLLRGMAYLREAGLRELNILHTVHAGNIGEIAALASAGRELGSGVVIFSPYVPTLHQGVQGEDLAVGPEAFLAALMDTTVDLSRCWVVMDLQWAGGWRDRYATELRQRLAGRMVAFAEDPVRYGMVRVTYDGRVMTPREAMHTREYRGRAEVCDERRLRRLLGATAGWRAA